jgi:hypothetical protein
MGISLKDFQIYFTASRNIQQRSGAIIPFTEVWGKD